MSEKFGVPTRAALAAIPKKGIVYVKTGVGVKTSLGKAG